MGNLRRIVGVGLAVALVAALAVYVLIPKMGPTANNVVVKEPQAPPSSGTGTTTGTGGSGSPGGHGGGSTGGTPPTTPPQTKPPNDDEDHDHGSHHGACASGEHEDDNGASVSQGAHGHEGECSDHDHGDSSHGNGYDHESSWGDDHSSARDENDD